MSKPRFALSDQQMDDIIGTLLRVGVALAALVSGVLLIRDAEESSGGGSHRTEFSIGVILILAAAFVVLRAQSWWKRRRS